MVLFLRIGSKLNKTYRIKPNDTNGRLFDKYTEKHIFAINRF